MLSSFSVARPQASEKTPLRTRQLELPTYSGPVVQLQLQQSKSSRWWQYEAVAGGDDDSKRQSAAGLVRRIALLLLFVGACLAVYALTAHRGALNGDFDGIGLEGASLSSISLKHDAKTGVYEVFLNNDLKRPYARGSYDKNVQGNGWNYLSVQAVTLESEQRSSHGGKGDKDKKGAAQTESDAAEAENEYLRSMVAMGYLEGSLTCREMQQWYVNFYSGLFDGGDPMDEALQFLETNHDWMVAQAEMHSRTSEYWLAARGTLAQLHGMLAGLRAGCPGTATPPPSRLQVLPSAGSRLRDFDYDDGDADDDYVSHTRKGVYLPTLRRHPCLIHLLLMNANGDLYQIAEKFNQKDAPASDGPLEGSARGSNHTHAHGKSSQPPLSRRHRFGRRATTTTAIDADSASSTSTTSSSTDGTNSPHRQRNSPDHALPGRGARSQGVDHCSALVKLLPDRSDVVFGHNTWDDFQSAWPRIFKNYKYPLMRGGKSVGVFEVYFSSSPALLSSVDDFYTIDGYARLAVLETTLDLYSEVTHPLAPPRTPSDAFEPSSTPYFHPPCRIPLSNSPPQPPSSPPAPQALLDSVQPQAMLSWCRARAANQLATDGNSWVDIFSNYSAGTYANEWMVLDFAKFTPGRDPRPGFLIVLEEVPGFAHWEDMTSHMRIMDYWASYNNPYFDDIAVMSGNAHLCALDPSACHLSDPRAKIFRAQQGAITSLAGLQALMDYNKFQTDPLSMNNSCNVS